MFEAALSKVEDARVNLDSLKRSVDGVQFKAAYTSFLSNCRAVTYALQKEGKRVPGFEEWYGTKRDELRDDELMRFFHDARTDDFHEGNHGLRFSTEMSSFSSGPSDAPPGASVLVMDLDGPFWLIDEGKPSERRVPVRLGQYQVRVSLERPPKKHRGEQLQSGDPRILCEMALTRMAELVHEARAKFGRRRE